MIVLNLQCINAHDFEGWFASGDAFETQNRSDQIVCPVCNDTHIRRTPSAPHVHARAITQSAPATALSNAAQLMARLRAAADTAEDVGKAFASEVRKITQGEAPDRSIRGQASREEVTALLDDGIEVLPVPPSKEDLH